METATQPRSLKLTIKLKRDKTVSTCTATADRPNNVEGESNVSSSSIIPDSLATSSQDVGLSSAERVNNHRTEDDQNPSSENSDLQLVLYDPTISGAENAETEADPSHYQPPSRPHPFANQPPRVLPAVGAFTVQCANCFKWRLIPTKEKYEEIREHIMSQPFSCETAREWRPEISCDDPPDITQDGSRLWAIDKPSIAQPPPGWQRLLRIRSEGSSKFADVYYTAPSGKRLRSMVEIQKYLNEHPRYIEEGVSLSQFSFQIPRPLQDNYVRKRPARPAPLSDAGCNWTPEQISAPEVQRLEWIDPDVDTELQLSGPTLSTDYFDAAVSNPEIQSAKKKKKMSSKQRYHNDLTYDHSEVNGTASPDQR